MRTLVLLLLLANLLFAAWAWWIAPGQAPASGRPTPVATDAGAIRLLREAPAPADADAPADAGVVDLNDAALACVSAGPYLERAQAQAAEANLQRLGFAVRLRESHESVRTGEWVRVENLATPEDAANALLQLQGAGVSDAYVLGDEAPGNVISLGVFTDPARARQVSAVARAAGFEPRTVAREREADVFWLDIDRQASAGLPSTEQLGADTAQLPPLELRRCPTAETEAPAAPAGAPAADGAAAAAEPASAPPAS